MKTIYFGSLRYKWLWWRSSLVEKRIYKLQDLSLYFLDRFEKEKSDKINAKIKYLYKRKEDLIDILQKYGTHETRREHNSKLK